MSPQRYREKADVLRAEYNRRFEEWHEKVDPAVLRELNRRRVVKGQARIRGFNHGSPRPLNGYLRYVYESTFSGNSIEQGFSYYIHVRDEHPNTEGDGRDYFKALSMRVSSQWRALSDAEKAVRTVMLW